MWYKILHAHRVDPEGGGGGGGTGGQEQIEYLKTFLYV